MAESNLSYSKFYVYNLESLAVSLREYKTIRMSEFYGMVDTLLKPKSHAAPENQEYSEEDKLQQAKMLDFID